MIVLAVLFIGGMVAFFIIIIAANVAVVSSSSQSMKQLEQDLRDGKHSELPPGYIFDRVDGEYRKYTPEEEVRQIVERQLISGMGFGKSQLSVEFPVKFGSKRGYLDIAVFPAGRGHTQENVWLIVECKRREYKDWKEGVEQLKSYMAVCPNAEWGLWTNGRFKLAYRKVVRGGRIVFEQQKGMPVFVHTPRSVSNG